MNPSNHGTGRVAGLLTTKNNRSSYSCARTFSSLSLTRPSSFHLGRTSHCRIVVECLNRASPYTHPPPTKPRPTPHSAPLLLRGLSFPPHRLERSTRYACTTIFPSPSQKHPQLNRWRGRRRNLMGQGTGKPSRQRQCAPNVKDPQRPTMHFVSMSLPASLRRPRPRCKPAWKQRLRLRLCRRAYASRTPSSNAVALGYRVASRRLLWALLLYQFQSFFTFVYSSRA